MIGVGASKDGSETVAETFRLFDWRGRRREREEEERRRAEAEENKERMEKEWAGKCEAARMLQRAVIKKGRVTRSPPDKSSPFEVSWTWKEQLWKYTADYVLDMRKYIEGKANQNVLVCGASGQGKSKLMRHLLTVLTDHLKIVISFKPNDEYLDVGFPIANVNEVKRNPFDDLDAFTSAFAITFPLDMVGITASQVPALVRDVARGCRNFSEFTLALRRRIKETRDMIQISALRFIDEHVKELQYGEGKTSGATNTNVSLLSIVSALKLDSLVIDLSELNDGAKVFYAELFIRQVWREMQTRPINKRVILCVDEAHRLTRGDFGRYHSAVREVSKEIRHLGALWVSTQNYSDMEDGMRNQFETQLVFKTTSKADLDALKVIDPTLGFAASSLPDYHFFDAKASAANREVNILSYHPYIAKIDKEKGISWNDEPDVPRQYFTEDLSKMLKTKPGAEGWGQAETSIDYTAVVREKVSHGEMVWVSRLARELEEKYSVGKDVAKLKLRNALLKLLEAGEVQVSRLDDPESGETISLYFTKSVNENESPLHRWMVGQVVEKSDDIIRVASSGEGLPDVETPSEYVEVETGLKRRIDDLQERVTKFSQTKSVVIVVPNKDVAEAYSKKLAPSGRVTVETLREYYVQK